MGDLSAEPSMEEILSSIKRIIAEEGEGTPARARRPQRAAAVPLDHQPQDDGEVLELSEPMPARVPTQRRVEEPAPEPHPVSTPPPSLPIQPAPQPARAADPIVSQQAAAASRGSLEALTRLVVKPENPTADNTLEGLVRELLRPMLRDWLDAHLPEIVEGMVAREIERITGSPQP